MANDGIIDSLFDKQKIGDEIKSVVDGIVGAQNSIKSLSETAATVANDMVVSFKKMKEAVNLTELNNGIRAL
jgi:hypothetical protein